MLNHKGFDGFGNRMENLLLSFPIYQLSQANDTRFKNLNLVELGVATMIFLLETMLSGRKRATLDDVTFFLQKTVQKVYKINYSQQEAVDLRKYLLDQKLRNNGKKFVIPYVDFETGESKEMLIDLIEYDQYSIDMFKDGKSYLKLSDQGVEVLFKTKEMYQEMQISITMLYFKQQLEKGVFEEALNSINDLALQIQHQINVFKTKEEKLKANVLTEFNYDKMKKELKDSRNRTAEERKQLVGLKVNVDGTREKYQLQQLTKEEYRKMDQIEEIDRMLRICTDEHAKLFIKKKGLLSTLGNALEMMIENIFSKTFHFEKEVIGNWYDNQMGQEKLSAILIPMMPMKVKKMYNPLEAFNPQKVRKIRKAKEEVIDEPTDEEVQRIQAEREKVRKAKERIDLILIEVLLKPLLVYQEYRVSDAIKLVRNYDFSLYNKIQNNYAREFMLLCIRLHESNYRQLEAVAMDQLYDVSEIVQLVVKITHKIIDLEGFGSFLMLGTDQVLEMPSGDMITDFIIKRKVSESDAV